MAISFLIITVPLIQARATTAMQFSSMHGKKYRFQLKITLFSLQLNFASFFLQ
jgi:hypothetical protein